MATANYGFYIDWDRDNGLRVSDFETDFDGWGPTTLLSLSTAQSYSGSKSLKATWQNQTPSSNPSNSFKFGDATYGFNTGVFAYVSTDPADDAVLSITYSFSGLYVGQPYKLSMWIYVPSSGGQHVKVGVRGLATSAATSTTNQWVNVVVPFTPTATTHTLFIDATGTVTNGNATYIDYVFVTGQYEYIDHVRSESVDWDYGRDQSRALNPVSPAEMDITLDNQDGRYSPNNSGSPLRTPENFLLPNREVLVNATYNGKVYDLFRGYLDDIEVNPHISEQRVKFSVVDPMASVGGTELSTQVWQGLRTGDAVHKVLDEIGWPANRRDIDPGATVLAYFWVDGQDASAAISDLVASEGPPAYATINSAGYFTFRDRHHRILDSRSNTSQVTFDALTVEPCFSPPMEINVGWKDIINSVTLDAHIFSAAIVDGTAINDSNISSDTDETDASETSVVNELAKSPVIWTYEGTLSIPAGETVTLFLNIDTPAQYMQVLPGDYKITGGPVTFSFSRTSGKSSIISVFAPSNSASITNLKVRGYPINQTDGVLISVTNDDSITLVGQKSDPDNIDAPWANANDAQAIGEIIVRTRSNSLPTVSITVNNGTTERLEQILSRRISDRIHILEPRSYTDADFYIESISHTLDSAGKFHTVKFGCEAVPTPATLNEEVLTPFTFGDPYAGFDSGAFSYDSVPADPNTMFVLDSSLLNGTEGLGY